MRTILKCLPILIAVSALWACNKRPVEGGLPVPQVAGNQLFPQSTSRDLDILFVIDNSISMGDEQTRLNTNLNTLMQALNSLQGGFPNAHIGVVSTDLGTAPYQAGPGCDNRGGDGGKLQDTPRGLGCTPPGDDLPFINIENSNSVLSGNIANVDTPTADGLLCPDGLPCPDMTLPCCGCVDMSNLPERATGDTALDLCDVQAGFRCIAALGTDGCGFEQPLESARKALTCDETLCPNGEEFLRDSAVLAIVFVGDEDDCSARRGDLFDTAQQSIKSELGGATSYRCFEFGVTCTPAINRSGQMLTGCRSKTPADVENPEDLYLYPIQEYYDFFSTLRPEGRVILAGITGPHRPSDEVTTVLLGMALDLEPACEGPEAGSKAAPSVRTNELIRLFGENGVVLQDVNNNVGICTNDFGPALVRLGEVIRSVLMPGCIGNPLIYDDDSEATADGPKLIETPDQATCSVIEVTNAGRDDEARQERGRCIFEGDAATACTDPSVSPGGLSDGEGDGPSDRSPKPCWYICDNGTADVGGCEYRWQMRFCRDDVCNPLTPAPALTDAYVQCLSCNPDALGCLCGDGTCQDGPAPEFRDVGENAANCHEDCAD